MNYKYYILTCLYYCIFALVFKLSCRVSYMCIVYAINIATCVRDFLNHH